MSKEAQLYTPALHDYAVKEPEPQPPLLLLAEYLDIDFDWPLRSTEVQRESTVCLDKDFRLQMQLQEHEHEHAIQPPSLPASAKTLALQYPLTHATPLFAFLRHAHSSASTFRIHVPCNDATNLSPYYRMPILEAQAQASKTGRRAGNWNCVSDFEEGGDADSGSEDGYGDGDEEEEEEDDDEDFDVSVGRGGKDGPQINHTQPPRIMPPSHSLILYLWGRGLSIASIASELGNLDAGFLHRLTSGKRWVRVVNVRRGQSREGALEMVGDVIGGGGRGGGGKGQLVKIGPHWEFDDGVAREVIEAFMGKRGRWEEMVSRGGGDEKRFELQKRLRGRAVEKLGKGVLENYLAYRLMGVWVHKGICV